MTKFTFQIPGSSHRHPAYKKATLPNVAQNCQIPLTINQIQIIVNILIIYYQEE